MALQLVKDAITHVDRLRGEGEASRNGVEAVDDGVSEGDCQWPPCLCEPLVEDHCMTSVWWDTAIPISYPELGRYCFGEYVLILDVHGKR